MMKTFITSLLLTTCSFSSVSQSPDWQWAVNIGSGGFDAAADVIADNNGNVYTIGTFESTVDFDPGPGVFNMTANPTTGSVFLTKYNASGNFIWAKMWNKSLYNVPFSLDFDANDNILVTGVFAGTTDFDPGPGTHYIMATAPFQYFILKLDNSGNFIWVKSFAGVNNTPQCYSAIGTSGNIYTAGFFTGTFDFNPGSGVFNMTSVSRDMFIVKFDPAGNFIWAKKTTASLNNWVNGIALDLNENIFITGSFSGTVDFDPGPAVYYLMADTTISREDIYILKLNSNGSLVWVRQIGGTSLNRPADIGIDKDGNVFTAGRYAAPADFDPGPGTFIFTSGSSFVLKLDNNGIFIWAQSFGNTSGGVQIASLALDTAARIYLSGGFTGVPDIDPGTGVYNLISDSLGFGLFISKFDSSCNLMWAHATGGYTHPGIQYNMATAVIADVNDNVYVAGRYEDAAISFGAITLVNATPLVFGFTDAFVAKFGYAFTSLPDVAGMKNDFNIFPNPGIGMFTIRSKEIIHSVVVYDLFGTRIMMREQSPAYIVNINLTGYPNGIYFCTFFLEDGKTGNGRIVLNR